MKGMSLGQAVEAMRFMERGEPYGLRSEDKKVRLLAEIERICRETGISPVVIGAMAVSHYGYIRFTADVVLLLDKEDASKLHARLKRELGWKRYAQGFKNAILDVGLDLCVEGERTSPEWEERFPSPSVLGKVRARPLPIVALRDLLALKVMSGRSQDQADVVNLLKRHPNRINALSKAARKRLRTREVAALLAGLVVQARKELNR